MARNGSRLFCTQSWDIMPEQGGSKPYSDLAESGRLGLQSEGIPVAGLDESLFANTTGPQAAFILRGRIDDLDASWCRNVYSASVDGTETVRWELYSSLEGRVVYTSTNTTEFHYDEDNDPSALVIRGINAGVEQSARLLAQEPGFRAALSKAPTSNVSGNPALAIASLPLFKATFQQNSQAVQDATVLLTTVGHGSGFFISRDGYVLTNAHVVGGLDQVRVELPNKTVLVGDVVRRNALRDVALIKVPIDQAPALPLRRSLPAVGMEVYAVGAPLDQALTGTVTKGIVSAIRSDSDGTRYIQADVDIQPGNSGGPLTDAQGNVVGVAVLGIQSAGGGSIGLNFFIPIEDALSALNIAVQ